MSKSSNDPNIAVAGPTQQKEVISASQRRPLLAMLLSILLPGFGQLYNGQVNKAIWIFLIFAAIVAPGVALIALYLPDRLMMPILLVGLVTSMTIWVYAVVDAWRGARWQTRYREQAWQQSGVYALVFVACNLVTLPLLIGFVRTHLVESFRIPSASMSPSILQGDYLFADKRYNCPSPACKHAVARGDVAIFTYPNDRTQRFIKRIIGLPGDQIAVKGANVTVNGQALKIRERTEAGELLFTEQFGDRRWSVRWSANATVKTATDLELTVPPGQVFVLGDSRNLSTDSRNFGTVPLQDVIGKARQIWFSSGEHGIRWRRLGHVVDQLD
jgi:signal peptidase I